MRVWIIGVLIIIGAGTLHAQSDDGSEATDETWSPERAVRSAADVEASIIDRPLLVGPVARLLTGFETSGIPVYNNSPDCGVFDFGTGYSTSAGFDVHLPSLLSQSLGLSASAQLARSAGRLETPPVAPTRVFDELTGQLVELDRHFHLDYSTWMTSVELLARVRFNDRIGVAVGPSFGYRFASSYHQSDNVLGPGDYRFPDGHSAKSMGDGTPLSFNEFTVGPTAILSYNVPVASNTLLQPGLVFHADVLSTVSEAPWRKFMAGATVSLLFDLRRTRPPVPDEPVPFLAASIKLYGMDENRREFPLAEIQMNELRSRQVAPLLPAVFFNSARTSIPDRYNTLTPSQADSFSIDNLQGVSVYEIQHHVLDIVGYRMRRNPDAWLKLAGRVSDGESPELRTPRAEAFRDYLVDVWKIDSSRIRLDYGTYWMEPSTEITEDGRSDNRRVEFYSNVEAVMAPVVTELTNVSFDPPYLKMVPRIDAEAGVRDWQIVVTQGDAELGHYSNRQSGGINQSDLSWRIVHDHFNEELSPVVATLTVTDSTGMTVDASDRLPLVMKHHLKVVDGRIVRSGNREQIAYTLVGFDFDLAELTWQNLRAIDEIASLTREGATIHITGYTDRIGDVQRNELLSHDRARNTASAMRAALDRLGVKSVKIHADGEGVETGRFTNDYPEGRVLSRGVSIEVEQSISAPVATESASAE